MHCPWLVRVATLVCTLITLSAGMPLGRVLGSYSISDLNVWNSQPFFLKVIRGAFPQSLIASISTGLSGPEIIYNVTIKQNTTGGIMSFDVSAAGQGQPPPSLTQAPWTINKPQSQSQWSTLSRTGVQIHPESASWPARQQTARFLGPDSMKIGPNLGRPIQSPGPGQQSPGSGQQWQPPIQEQRGIPMRGPITIMTSPLGTEKPPGHITSSILDGILPKTQSGQSTGHAVPSVTDTTTSAPQKVTMTTRPQTTTTTAATTTTTMRPTFRPTAPPPTPRPTSQAAPPPTSQAVPIPAGPGQTTTINPLLDPEGFAEMYFTEGPDLTIFPPFTNFGQAGSLFAGFQSFPFIK